MGTIDYPSGWLVALLSREALITSLSSSAELFTGCPAEELAGMPVTRILADYSAFEIPRILAAAREGGIWEGEMVHRDRSGNTVKARSKLALVASFEGRQRGYFLISDFDPIALPGGSGGKQEITAKLRAFIHALNNPLAILMGSIQLLTLEEGCQGKIRADVERLYSELRRLAQVVEELRDYAISLSEPRL
jgi:signal transduction histidine kinase